MKKIQRIFLALAALTCVVVAQAQDSSSSSSVMRRGKKANKEQTTSAQVTQRMQQRLQTQPMSDADMSWMKVIYRSLDLTKEANAPLYFPEQPIEGSESLFRIIMRLLSQNQLSAYEYLDGREVFTDQYKVKVRDVLDRFQIYYEEAKGSTEKRPLFTINESDVPATEVLSYYIIERWEFDTRTNRLGTTVEAICPVLHRTDDFGMESVKYPMFWIKFSDIRPYLSTQNIFISDDNNIATYTYDDYFRLALYDGEIYKTRNLRNKSMMQLYPEPEARKRAQDSIQSQLDNFDKKLWVPSLEELEKMRQQREASDTTAVSQDDVKEEKGRVSTSRRGKKSDAKPAKVKRSKTSSAKTKQAATRSVRNRRR